MIDSLGGGLEALPMSFSIISIDSSTFRMHLSSAVIHSILLISSFGGYT